MIAESKIAEYINSALLSGMHTSPFAGTKVHGLTEIYSRDKEKLPAEIIDGELIYIGIDDTYPVIIYHRCDSTNIVQDKSNSFGSGGDEKETSNMRLFVFAQSQNIKMNSSETKSFIGNLIPNSIDKTLCNILGIKSGFVQVNSCNFNSSEIFKKEYTVSKKLDPKFSLIEIKYSIETRYNNKCVKTLCDNITNN